MAQLSKEHRVMLIMLVSKIRHKDFDLDKLDGIYGVKIDLSLSNSIVKATVGNLIFKPLEMQKEYRTLSKLRFISQEKGSPFKHIIPVVSNIIISDKDSSYVFFAVCNSFLNFVRKISEEAKKKSDPNSNKHIEEIINKIEPFIFYE